MVRLKFMSWIDLFLSIVLVKLFLQWIDRALDTLKVTRWSRSLKSRSGPLDRLPSSLISSWEEGVEGEAPLFTRWFVPLQELELNVEITLRLRTFSGLCLSRQSSGPGAIVTGFSFSTFCFQKFVTNTTVFCNKCIKPPVWKMQGSNWGFALYAGGGLKTEKKKAEHLPSQTGPIKEATSWDPTVTSPVSVMATPPERFSVDFRISLHSSWWFLSPPLFFLAAIIQFSLLHQFPHLSPT